jgi:hypothetical protein
LPKAHVNAGGYPFLREVASPLTPEMLAPLDPRCKVVQFRSLLADADFAQLAGFLAEYPDVPLRAYGNYDNSIRDLQFLRFFPRLRHFRIDVWTLQDLGGLQYLPADLQSLGLGATKSRRFSLGLLTRFPHLCRLFIESHSKDIEAVGHLGALEDLTLRSITLPDLRILIPLRQLRSLDIKLGGTKDLRLLPEVGRLRYIELWMVKGLSELDPVGTIPTLQCLFLQSLRKVERLPSLSEATALRRVHIETLKGLRDLTPLCTAPALEEVQLLDMGHLSADDVRCLTRIPTLRRALVLLGSRRKNDAAREILPLPAPDRFRFEFR